MDSNNWWEYVVSAMTMTGRQAETGSEYTAQ